MHELDKAGHPNPVQNGHFGENLASSWNLGIAGSDAGYAFFTIDEGPAFVIGTSSDDALLSAGAGAGNLAVEVQDSHPVRFYHSSSFLDQTSNTGEVGAWAQCYAVVGSMEFETYGLYGTLGVYSEGQWFLTPEAPVETVEMGDYRMLLGEPGSESETGTVEDFIRVETDTGGDFPDVDWVQVDTLHDPGAQLGNRFGAAVATSGSWLAVGAPREDLSFPFPEEDVGRVFLYKKNILGGWDLQTTIWGIHDSDFFGASLDMEGNRLVIGAPGVDSVGPVVSLADVGRVYLFELVGGEWVETAEYAASDPRPDARLGASVVLSGYQGRNGVIAGAPGARIGMVYHVDGAGALYLFGHPPLFADGFETGDTSEWTSAP